MRWSQTYKIIGYIIIKWHNTCGGVAGNVWPITFALTIARTIVGEVFLVLLLFHTCVEAKDL